MYAWLIESSSHRPLLRFEDGSTGIPVNLGVYTRHQFLSLVGHRFEVRTQLSPRHFTLRIPEQTRALH